MLITTLLLSLSSVSAAELPPKGDHYENFAELEKTERKGRDYQVTVIDHKDPITVMAIHGGLIELGSSQLARRIAGSDKNLYLFEGVRNKHNQLLHLTSTRFDEPQALKLVKQSENCVSIHGYRDTENAGICIGGLNQDLAKSIYKNLREAKLKYDVFFPCELFPGKEPDNIVNRCKNKGVQLEVSSKLRNIFQQNPDLETKTITAIRASFLK